MLDAQPTSGSSTSADKAQRRSQRRNEVMRTMIIDAAVELLLGTEKTEITMEEIADSAAVSTASLYKYFPGKKTELFKALADRVIKTDARFTTQAFDDRKSPIDELIGIGHAYLRFGLEYPGYFRLIAQPSTIAGLDDRQLGRLARAVSHFLDRVAAVIRRGQRPDLPPTERIIEADPRAIAEVLHGAWNGVLELSLRDDDDVLARKKEELNALATLATAIVRRGLVVMPPADLPEAAVPGDPLEVMAGSAAASGGSGGAG